MSRETASAMWAAHRDTQGIRKAEDFAKFTIPSLMADPLKGHDQADTLEYDFQSYGALLVNNLTSKLVSALFPAGRPCFQITLDATLRDAAKQRGVDDTALNAATAKLELSATERLFRNANLAKLTRAVKLLITTGDALLYRDTRRGKFLVWSKQSYTVRRDAFGDLSTVVLKQRIAFEHLPQEVQADATSKRIMAKPSDKLEYYTVIEWRPTPQGERRVVVWNELEGKRVGPESSYPEHLCPWVPVAWNVPDGEHYGRGYVEEYSGAFAKISILSEQLGLYELEALNMLNLVDEAAGAVIDDYKNASTGDYIPGKVGGSVGSYERGDYNKITAIRSSIEADVMLLNRAFMYTGQMRDAERVTVEEVRTIAREAENLMGGTYSLLAEHMQAPLAYLMMYEEALTDPDFMLGLVQKSYRPTIVTGIPALTRSAAVQALFKSAQEVAAVVPALAQVSQRFDPERVIELIFRSNSAPLEEISKSADQIAAEAEAEAAQANASLDVASGALAANESIPGVLNG